MCKSQLDCVKVPQFILVKRHVLDLYPIGNVILNFISKYFKSAKVRQNIFFTIQLIEICLYDLLTSLMVKSTELYKVVEKKLRQLCTDVHVYIAFISVENVYNRTNIKGTAVRNIYRNKRVFSRILCIFI